VQLPAQVAIDAPEATRPLGNIDIAALSPESRRARDTIVVVDDDAAVRDLMSRFLTKLGFRVAAASTGEEGLRLARQLHPLLITLDVVMPECDGWAVLKKLKGDRALADIPVIMVTIVDNQALGLDLGASGYLVKPVDRDRLADLIGKHRSGSGSGTEAVPSAKPKRDTKSKPSGELHAEDLVGRR
jgi:DNA-binding response OmpR family regulator